MRYEDNSSWHRLYPWIYVILKMNAINTPNTQYCIYSCIQFLYLFQFL